jgi:triacylglycerol lipase
VAGFLVAPASGASAATAHTPVVFVHGYTGSASNWTTAIAQFESAGYSSNELYAFQYDWSASNKTSAQQLATYVSQVRARTGSDKVDIVNHSMGGLVTRWYVSELGGAAYVKHVASLAGANHGTTGALAGLHDLLVVPGDGAGFVVHPAAHRDRRRDARLGDGVINPYTSTELSGATNNLVPCENHITYLTDATVLTAVRTFLAS